MSFYGVNGRNGRCEIFCTKGLVHNQLTSKDEQSNW